MVDHERFQSLERRQVGQLRQIPASKQPELFQVRRQGRQVLDAIRVAQQKLRALVLPGLQHDGSDLLVLDALLRPRFPLPAPPRRPMRTPLKPDGAVRAFFFGRSASGPDGAVRIDVGGVLPGPPGAWPVGVGCGGTWGGTLGVPIFGSMGLSFDHGVVTTPPGNVVESTCRWRAECEVLLR